MNTTDRILVTTFLIGVVFLIGFSHAMADSNARRAQMMSVQATCDAAHRELSGISERDCGNAQDASQTEYLCDSNTVDATCWVEDKR